MRRRKTRRLLDRAVEQWPDVDAGTAGWIRSELAALFELAGRHRTGSERPWSAAGANG